MSDLIIRWLDVLDAANRVVLASPRAISIQYDADMAWKRAIHAIIPRFPYSVNISREEP